MPQIPDFNQAFEDYLKSHNADHHTMRECWMAAAQWMANDVIATLADYATVCEGLPAQQMTPSQKFDEVRDSLSNYFNQILKETP